MGFDRLALQIPLFVASGVLVGSGVEKLLRPAGTSRALATAGLPSRFLLVRALGVAEAGVGAWCLLRPIRPAAIALGVLYAAFAAFLMLVRARGGEGATCGCFGDGDGPPSLLHLAFDLGAGLVATLDAMRPVPGLPTLMPMLPFHGLSFGLGIATAAYLASAALRFLPQIQRVSGPAGRED